jgi:membrane-bound serine protease (ClpP class)
MLIDTDDPAMQISHSVLYPTLATTVLIALGTLYLATKSAQLKATSGAEGMIGATGVAKETLDPEGNVYVHGELWSAVCDGTIAEGESVVVEKIDGLTVKVKKANVSS